MMRIAGISILIILFAQQFAGGQSASYTVTKTAFSTKSYDEFSPVIYKNGLVFSTNSRDNQFLNYSGEERTGNMKIYFIEQKQNGGWKRAGLFSKNLTTRLNDGLATFNSGGDTIYYSRNLMVDDNLDVISSPKNKLGIFSAVLVEGKWTRIRSFRFNNEWYNITAPSLSPDGKWLFFSSDQPGGYGGSDLYYCQWIDNYWSDPVNLGPLINTTGNESYPYASPSGDLYFSSDGHEGLGGKDIFVTRLSDSGWIAPIHLARPINSEFDDFGIVTDSTGESGFFSSKRGKSVDIFKFRRD